MFQITCDHLHPLITINHHGLAVPLTEINLGIAMTGDPETFMYGNSPGALALQPIDHLINEVATLPPDASPYLSVPAHATSLSSFAAPNPLTAVYQGVPRHAQ